MATCADVLTLEKLESLLENPHNSVHLSGLVINTWSYSDAYYTRLAIYNELTEIIKYRQPFPKHKAYFVTVWKSQELREDGKTQGQGEIISAGITGGSLSPS